MVIPCEYFLLFRPFGLISRDTHPEKVRGCNYSASQTVSIFKIIDKLLHHLDRDDRAELDRRVVGDRDDVAVQLRVEDADGAEAMRNRVDDGAGNWQAGWTIQQDSSTSRQFARRIHLGEASHNILDDDIVGSWGTKADLHNIGGTDDVVAVHDGLLFELRPMTARTNCPDG